MTADDRAGDAAREQIQTLIAKLRDAHEDLQSDEYNAIGRLNTLAWIGERTPLILAAFGFLLAALDAAEAATLKNKAIVDAALEWHAATNSDEQNFSRTPSVREKAALRASRAEDALDVVCRAALGGDKG